MTTTFPAARTRNELHHGSHNHLLDDVPGDASGRLDGIIVPTFRQVDALRDSLALAAELRLPLVALCSGQAKADEAKALARRRGAQIRAIDLHEVSPEMPAFRGDRVLLDAGFAPTGDLHLKRNLGLLLARSAGWERVLFLDDDIFGVRGEELAGAAAALDTGRYRAVGLHNAGFPDNSVVCHAYRAIGAEQASFIGGGAMIVDPTRSRSFFPSIYNEDWFFLLGDGVPFRAARSGTMRQRSYDPFATPLRARNEELGDTVAEGLFWLLDGGRDPATSDRVFWSDFLYRRRALLDHVLAKVDAHVLDAPRAAAIKAALRAAQGASAYLTPQLCAAFVQAWTLDLRAWAAFLRRFPADCGMEKALAELGLIGHSV